MKRGHQFFDSVNWMHIFTTHGPVHSVLCQENVVSENETDRSQKVPELSIDWLTDMKR